MKIITKRKLSENALTRSVPGIPDVRRISCAELVGSLTSFCAKYLRGAAEVYGPDDTLTGAIGISATQLGAALRATVDKLAQGEAVKIYFTEWDDEMNLRIEAKGLEDTDATVEVIEAWRRAGFKLKRLGFSMTLSMAFENALRLVVREPNTAIFSIGLYHGYFD